MLDALGQGLLAVAAAGRGARVVLTAMDTVFFSAGHDLKELTAAPRIPNMGVGFFERVLALARSSSQQDREPAPTVIAADVRGGHPRDLRRCQLGQARDLAVAFA